MAALITGIIAAGLFIILFPIFLLSADFARAWISANGNASFLKAIGMGFKLAFKKFWASYFLMIFMIIIQVVLVILVLKIIPHWHPSTALTMMTLFLVSQFSVFLRLLFRTWRYAGVTSLMEYNQQEIYAPAQ
jgi:hypothetical protein